MDFTHLHKRFSPVLKNSNFLKSTKKRKECPISAHICYTELYGGGGIFKLFLHDFYRLVTFKVIHTSVTNFRICFIYLIIYLLYLIFIFFIFIIIFFFSRERVALQNLLFPLGKQIYLNK